MPLGFPKLLAPSSSGSDDGSRGVRAFGGVGSLGSIIPSSRPPPPLPTESVPAPETLGNRQATPSAQETALGSTHTVTEGLPTPPEDNTSKRWRPKLPVGNNSFTPFRSPNQEIPTPPPEEPATPVPEKPAKKLKLPDAFRKITNLDNLEIEGSLLGGDLSITNSEKQAKKEGLCSSCSKIDFEQFSAEIPPTTSVKASISYKLIFLDRILRKKRRQTCRFCELLFDAIAENDPFSHPAVKNHLPPELNGMTFAQWAGNLNVAQHIPLYKTAYPFGRSRDNIDMQHKIGEDGVVRMEDTTREDELTTSDMANIGGIGATAGLGFGMLTETDQQRMKIMMTVGTVIPTITSLVSNLDSKLPVAVSIMLHNVGDVDAGLINVDVWGYGNAHRAPLSRISTFNLRVASGYSHIGSSLHYGKILRDQIDVEGDCRLWLDNCLRHHTSCDTPRWAGQLPSPTGPHFRLIDVSDMRVVVVHGHPPPYAALSYVWGAAGQYALKLSAGNADALSVSLEGHDRPITKTIHDAMDVTRRLGIPYLWVDSLCIMQKDEFAGDDEATAAARESQISQMDSVYGHAQVTLVAADGIDAEAGLAGITAGTRAESIKQIAEVVVPGINVLVAMKYSEGYGLWDTRAWTLQEKLLSKRLLIFSGSRVSFHCREGILREDMPAAHAGNGPPRVPWLDMPEQGSGAYAPGIRREWDGAPVVTRAGFFSEYAALVGQYSARRMTDSRDALNAVFGLLKVLERMAVDGSEGLSDRTAVGVGLGHTLYGLPERFLDLALMWQPPAAQGIYLTKKTHDLLPSWSWAGWEVGADATVETKLGVRFDEPFWAATNDDLSLRKVVGVMTGSGASGFSIRKVLSLAKDKAASHVKRGPKLAEDGSGEERPLEERYRPLTMWFRGAQPPPLLQGTRNHGATSATHRLVPVNGHGLGLGFDAADKQAIESFVQAAIRLRGIAAQPQIPIHVPLDNRHLVCQTQVAAFRLRPAATRHEKLWKRANDGLVVDKELVIVEIPVVDALGRVVGTVIPTDSRMGVSSEPYSFVLLSEAQYWGDENRVDVSGMPLYNVMVVEWDTYGQFAARIAVGKVRKTAWAEAKPSTRVVILK
ncbi:hypothetical protein OQA88_12741 [Cercophora sp. LCS_1]